MHLLILAKQPLAGRAKTRLAPRFGPEGSAELAAAALADTCRAAAACHASRVVVAFDGDPAGLLPNSFDVVPQVPGDLGQRLAAAWEHAGAPGLQIGMDTPQVSATDLDEALAEVTRPDVDAVLGLAEDGGWWAIGFRCRPRSFVDVFDGIPTSRSDTGSRQLARLRAMGLRTVLLPTRPDVDRPDDVELVAAQAPDGRFARTAARLGGVEATAAPGANRNEPASDADE